MKNLKQQKINDLLAQSFKDNQKEFNIVEYATMKIKNNGTIFWDRHHFLKTSYSYTFPTDENHFQSHFLHSHKIEEYFQNSSSNNKGSLAGYDESIWVKDIVLDIDNKDNPEESLITLRIFLRRLKSKYGVDRRLVSINFSGQKGFHVRLPAAMFGNFEPSCDLNDMIKYIMQKLTAGLKGFDFSIYNKLSLVRIVNSKHAGTGLYSIPLSVQEIREKTFLEIKALAKLPRIIKKIDQNKIHSYQKLVDLKNDCMKNGSIIKESEPSFAGSIIKKVGQGNRHNERLRLVRIMMNAGATLQEIISIALYNNRRNKVEDREKKSSIIKEIEEMYNSWKKKLKFYNVGEDNKIKISYTKYLQFLEREGYAKYYIGSRNVIVHNRNNCLREIEPSIIKDFIRNYLFSSKAGRLAYEFMLHGANKYFSNQYLEHLKPIGTELIRDSVDICNFFFANGLVTVNGKGDITTTSYDKVDGLIWEENLIDREFHRGSKNGDFRKFIKNVSGTKPRYYFLVSLIGYLLHRYKNPSYAKAVILYDLKASANPMGRTGKSIIGKAIAQLRERAFIDGRNFNMKGQFAFQQVKLETEFIDCNDVSSKFPFESFFSIITDDMIVERKNRNSITIPFSDSPKILISTNFALSGIGDSYKDRKIEFEFTNHYNANHKPVDDFGKMFFDEWDKEEWSRFDNFMIYCVIFYLKHGVKELPPINVNIRRIMDVTSEEFYKFVRKNITLNVEHSFSKLYNNFKETVPEDDITSNMFTKWLKKYAEHMEYSFEERHSNGQKFIEIKKIIIRQVKK